MYKKVILSILLIFFFQEVFAQNDVFVYLLKYRGARGDVVVYCGITNDPETRALEHAEGGTLGYNTFDTMVVFAGPMSREQALEEETRCIYRYEIPRLYQTYPRDLRAIAEYESHYDASRLVQTRNPIVEYTPEVQRAIDRMFEYPIEQPTCEDCRFRVTNGVVDYSLNHFNGHIFCMRCQSHHW